MPPDGRGNTPTASLFGSSGVVQGGPSGAYKGYPLHGSRSDRGRCRVRSQSHRDLLVFGVGEVATAPHLLSQAQLALLSILCGYARLCTSAVCLRFRFAPQKSFLHTRRESARTPHALVSSVPIWPQPNDLPTVTASTLRSSASGRPHSRYVLHCTSTYHGHMCHVLS